MRMGARSALEAPVVGGSESSARPMGGGSEMCTADMGGLEDHCSDALVNYTANDLSGLSDAREVAAKEPEVVASCSIRYGNRNVLDSCGASWSVGSVVGRAVHGWWQVLRTNIPPRLK